ncbi:hypothetical protein HK097_006809 [Rhizophlyctis rosea]|uniref:Crossover junction endonuclease MUS81-like HHH domain-containing protein n=1 Tax=Rhizophlyctis rosea TaxID=64517 RepID=A0AAD5SE98_9FUNG|nr:hypothetical protein HK097_006809 [Rhizophlyctis rosea]
MQALVPGLMLPTSSGSGGDSQFIDLDALIREQKQASVEEDGVESDDESGGEGDDDVVEVVGDESVEGGSESQSTSKPLRNQSRFLCMQKSARVTLDAQNKNKAVTDLLEKVLERHEADGDQWRILSYRKAIQILKRYPRKIESGEEAKRVHGIGGKIADKVWKLI